MTEDSRERRPSLAPFARGVAAYRRRNGGRARFAASEPVEAVNPFAAGTSDHDAWEDGYEAASQGYAP